MGVSRLTRVLVLTRLRPAVAVAVLVAASIGLSGCASSDARQPAVADTEPSEAPVSAPQGEGLCALTMSYEGRAYESAPKGPPDRVPDLTGRTAVATVPGCDDGGGEVEPQDVQVDEIVGVPLDEAFWWQDAIMLPAGGTLPESLEDLYQPTACDFSETVEVIGEWLGVTTSKPVRFDGDLRTPLRIDLYVEEVSDPGVDLERYTIRVHDVGEAVPALDKSMAEEALWSSRAALEVSLVCADGEFRATSFGLVPR